MIRTKDRQFYHSVQKIYFRSFICFLTSSVQKDFLVWIWPGLLSTLKTWSATLKYQFHNIHFLVISTTMYSIWEPKKKIREAVLKKTGLRRNRFPTISGAELRRGFTIGKCPLQDGLDLSLAPWPGMKWACVRVLHLYCKVFDQFELFELIVR